MACGGRELGDNLVEKGASNILKGIWPDVAGAYIGTKLELVFVVVIIYGGR